MDFNNLEKDNSSLKEFVCGGGKIVPTGTLIASTELQGNRIVVTLKEDIDKLEEAVVFFYAYNQNLPLLVSSIEIQNRKFSIPIDKGMISEMYLIHANAIRISLALNIDGLYSCYYLKNKEARAVDEETGRYIGKLGVSEGIACIAYYSKGGNLSIKFMDEKSFDNIFYTIRMNSYTWIDEKLVCEFEVPSVIKNIQIKLRSVSSRRILSNISMCTEDIENNNLKNLWKTVIDFSEMDVEDSDGYQLECVIGGETHNIYYGGEACDEDLCEITLKTNEKLNLCVITDLKDKVIIKSGKIYPVMISVVTAVYNVAPFLADMINSVITQKIDKLENYRHSDYTKDYYKDIYELILVDDGSTDGSARILDDYARISDKIKVIHKKNGGVSSARNAGIAVARGKYFNFADSDDKLSKNFLEETVLFFEKNYDAVDIVTTPLQFFDGLNEPHWSNGKFSKGSRAIDLNKEPFNCLMFVNASVFKSEKIKEKRLFNENLRTAEDINFIYSFLIEEKPFLGVIDSCSYLYRRRTEGEESLIQRSQKDKNRYAEYFTIGMKYLVDASEKVYGTVPRYVQYLMACDLQWRFGQDGDAKVAKSVLTDEEFETYKNYLYELLQYIDLDIIWNAEKIYREQKMFMTKFRGKEIVQKKYVQEKENIFYISEGQNLWNAGSNFLKIDLMKITNSTTLYIEVTNHTYESNSELYIKVDDKYIPMIEMDSIDLNVYAIGEKCFYGKHYFVEVKLDRNIDEYELCFYEKIDGYFVKKTDIRYGFLVPLSSKYRDSYFIENGWCVRKEGTFRIRPIRFSIDTLSDLRSLNSYLRYENDYLSNISSKDGDMESIINLRKVAINIIEKQRLSGEKIWLISDRVNVAGDNGEALFIYLNKIKPQNVHTFFVINKNCEDYNRMKKYGNVVGQGTQEHKLLHFMAEYVISSQFDEYIENPFWFEDKGREAFKDLVYRPKFVFLQHGITKNDLSRWLNRLNKDFTGFVTAAQPEYDSILSYPYMYTAKEVWLTGFPRFDRLYHDEKRYITIMPTWRSYLSKREDNRMVMKPGFKDTDYFKFYNQLLNNHRLLENAEKYGYKICFRPHPTVMNNINDFDHDERVMFFDDTVPYRTIYAQSDMCVTDYSSSVMDFSYLRKPVVYIQFDKEKFFSGEHIANRGYFNDERDGFGEVTYDMDTLVNQLIEYMKNDCLLKEKYRDRIDRFFKYNDTDNCKRVYEKLLEAREI